MVIAMWAMVAVWATSQASAQKGEPFRVVEDTYETLQIEFLFAQPVLGDTTLCGAHFSTLDIEGCLPGGVPGAPALPYFSRLIEVPLCSDFLLTENVLEFDTLQLDGPQLAPMQRPRSKSDTGKAVLAYTRGIYTTDVDFGAREATVKEVGIARDRRLARLEYYPVRYNPVKGQVYVARRVRVTVYYKGADKEGTLALFEKHHSPAFSVGDAVINSLYPKAVRSTAPVRYLIVANSMFRNQLDIFIEWKRRKGFMTDIVYTDNPAVGSTTTSIAAYLKSQYTGATAANPAPTYVLLVGDVDQLPPFQSQITNPGYLDNDHVTDLYYMTWSAGDHIPDCYYGRFSAQTLSQLTPQIQKTLMYEQYTFADPSFLDRAVMVAGVDGGNNGDYGYTHADPAMDYCVTNYVNGIHGFADVRYFKNNTSRLPGVTANVNVASSVSGMSATVRSYYDQGAGLINYSAHGSTTSWATPSLTTTHVNAMTNTQKFGLMIGNCCLTNKFDVGTCLGEALLRKGNYCGAVGYIGCSNSSYWDEDFYWAVGVRNGIGATMSMNYSNTHLGVYDRIFHTHNEAYALWSPTQGSMIMQGDIAVESSSTSSTMKQYYWEIYHLMGDPSLMPYMSQASSINIVTPASITHGSTTVSITAVPYAYVALTQGTSHDLVAAGFADASGNVTLSLPADLSMGTYEIAASAQQYRTTFRTISVSRPAGPYVNVASVSPTGIVAGTTSPLVMVVENQGTATARNIVVRLGSASPLLTLSADSLSIDSLQAGTSMTLSGAVLASVSPIAVDLASLTVNCSTTWNGATQPVRSEQEFVAWAPVVSFGFDDSNVSMLPGSSHSLNAVFRNSGHAAASPMSLAVSTPTGLLTASVVGGATTTLAPGAEERLTVNITADSRLTSGITLPLNYIVSEASSVRFSGELPIFLGPRYTEDFEDNTFHTSTWAQGSRPWTVIDTHAYEGTYCLRSANNLPNNANSEISLTLTVDVDDSVSFYFSVSSEENYDKFYFFIDNSQKVTASGEEGWSRVAFPIAAGTHTLKFRYAKDGSQQRGSDCAWIDNLILPHGSRQVSFVSNHVCVGDDLVVDGQAVNTSSEVQYSTIQLASDGSVELTNYEVHPNYVVDSQMVVCDSYQWIDRTVTESTSLYDTLRSTYGCDSVVSLLLTVNHSYSDTLSVTTEDVVYVWNNVSYSTSGTFEQHFSTQEGCDSSLVLELTLVNVPDDPPLSIDEVEGAEVTLYPNPTTGTLHLSTTVDEAVVYNLLGHELMCFRQANRLDLNLLPQGTYFVRLTLSGTSVVRRVTKQ